MRVHVAFTPAETAAAPTGLVIDVIRATSTVCQALDAGYTRVYCTAEVEDARRLKDELEGVTQPVCIIWGDRDFVAPAEVLNAYRPLPSRMKNVEVHIFPGIAHGFMMHEEAFDQATYDFSMERALSILAGLREKHPDIA